MTQAGRSGSDRRRVLVLGLDGFDPALADRFIAQGLMPHLRRLKAEGATAALDHGRHRMTGLSWEHFATGLTPEASGRWAAVALDPARYDVVQPATRGAPFLAGSPARAVIFDAPYFDLDAVASAQGLVNWGAHDPGVEATARPAGLDDEIRARFGGYPAQAFIYGFLWPSAERTRAAAAKLTEALRLRSEISLWLLGERLPDWDVAVLVAGEPHSAIEPMWHGVDPAHPLAGLESAAAARDGLAQIYGALDEMIGALRQRFPDATLLAFTMHGMGANNADVSSMLLLPEFCYRRAFGRPLFQAPEDWRRRHREGGAPPLLGPDESWERATISRLRHSLGARAAWRLRRRLARAADAAAAALGAARGAAGRRAGYVDLDWMPAYAYRRYWPRMEAFAIPSFYDGRIRLNLAGREGRGRVAPARYFAARDQIAEDLVALRDPITGESVVAEVHLEDVGADPRAALALDDTRPDLTVDWRPQAIVALESPRPEIGVIGPAPIRRTGGHTGGDGALYAAGPPFRPGALGRISAFDVAPTVADLLGGATDGLSGRSRAPAATSPEA